MLPYDLNCDTGEGTNKAEALMPFMNSANIACGFDAGDKDTMKKAVELCLHHNVLIGAHPSYPDRENFGRLDLAGTTLRPPDLHAIVAEQVDALQRIVKEQGAVLHHVKPHGSRYNRAARDPELAYHIYTAIAEIDGAL